MSVGFGQTNGLDDQFTNPYDSHQPNDGDSQNGGHGPLGSNVDGITCDASMADSGYHVHFFIGLYVNGQQIAVPDGVGMSEPSGEATFNNVPNQTEYVYPSPGSTQGCYYGMHTHDPSGVVHVEVPNPNNVPITQSMTTLGQFLDIWGQSIDLVHFGQYNGPVTIYTSGQTYRGGQNNGYVYSYTYSQFTGDPMQMPIYSHEVIWIMVGSGNPALNQLPNVDFFEEY